MLVKKINSFLFMLLPQVIFDNILNRNIPWPGVPEDMSYEAQDLINRYETRLIRLLYMTVERSYSVLRMLLKLAWSGFGSLTYTPAWLSLVWSLPSEKKGNL